MFLLAFALLDFVVKGAALLWFWSRRHHLFIQKRGPHLVCMVSLVNLAHHFLLNVFAAFPDSVPGCWVFYIVNVFLCITLSCFVCRCVHLVASHKVTRSRFLRGEDHDGDPFGFELETGCIPLGTLKNMFSWISSMIFRKLGPRLLNEFFYVRMICWLALPIISLLLIPCYLDTKMNAYRPWAVTFRTIDFFSTTWIVQGSFVLIVVILTTPTVFYHLKTFRDSIHFRDELLALTSLVGLITILCFVWYQNSDDLVNFVHPLLFISLSGDIACIISNIVPALATLNIGRSDKTLAYNRDSLDRVLEDDELRSKLKEEATCDFTVENLLFVEDVQSLKWLLRKHVLVDPEFLPAIRNIYKKFISRSASMPLNLDYKATQKLRLTIGPALEDGSTVSLDISVFDEAYQEIKDLIYENTYSRFIAKRGVCQSL